MHLVRPQLDQSESLGFGNPSAPENREMEELERIVWKPRDAQMRLCDWCGEEDRGLPESLEGIFPPPEFLFTRSAQQPLADSLLRVRNGCATQIEGGCAMFGIVDWPIGPLWNDV